MGAPVLGPPSTPPCTLFFHFHLEAAGLAREPGCIGPSNLGPPYTDVKDIRSLIGIRALQIWTPLIPISLSMSWHLEVRHATCCFVPGLRPTLALPVDWVDTRADMVLIAPSLPLDASPGLNLDASYTDLKMK